MQYFIDFLLCDSAFVVRVKCICTTADIMCRKSLVLNWYEIHHIMQQAEVIKYVK